MPSLSAWRSFTVGDKNLLKLLITHCKSYTYFKFCAITYVYLEGDFKDEAVSDKQGDRVSWPDCAKLYDRLFRLAMTKVKDVERASDLASETITDCMDEYRFNPVALEWFYASMALMNRWKTNLRNSGRREINLPNKRDDEIVEMRRLSTSPVQETYAIAMDAMRGLKHLPEMSQRVMAMTGLECSADEISEHLGIPKSEVYWRTRVSREILKSKGYWEPPKKGQYKWIGIRRECRKWQAEIKVDGKCVYLGHFDTASQAALAFDDAAKKYRGDKAKLNFPKGCQE